MTTTTSRISLVGLALALAACGNDGGKVDLGDGDRGVTAQGLAAYEGSWDGYVEARNFESGSDRVLVTLDAQGHGSIEFGDAPAIAPFSDPDVGYPTTWSYDSPTYELYKHSMVQEGFAYPALDAAVTSGRLSFQFWPTDIVKDWCEAQTPMLDDATPPSWRAVPSGSVSSGPECPGPSQPGLDCGKVMTGLFACSCDESSCTSVRELAPLRLDGALTDDGDALVGTLILPLPNQASGNSAEMERVTVRLTR